MGVVVVFLLVILVESGSDLSYHNRILLQTSACSNEADCVPSRFNSTVIPPNLIDCIQGQCICQECFMVASDGSCTLRECRDYTSNGCEDNRKSQLTAILLSVFLSAVGAANFYIDRDGLAAGQLVLFLIILFSSCAVCFPLCCICCAKDENSYGAFLTIYFCLITILIVLASLAQSAWWIADLVIFANNDREDGDGCSLRPA